MTSLTCSAHRQNLPSIPLGRRLFASLALIALADWLFYLHEIGISLAIFLLALCLGSALGNAPQPEARQGAKAGLLLALSLLPLVEDASLLSLLFGAAGAAIFVQMLCGQWKGSFALKHWLVARLYLIGPWRLIADALGLRKLARRMGHALPSFRGLAKWVVPLVCGAIFLRLFVDANPVIDLLVPSIDLSSLFGALNVGRGLLWLVIACLVWPFLHLKPRRLRAHASPMPVPQPSGDLSAVRALLLSDGAVLRSLVVFNILFALQTGLDLTYLWAGAALPLGMGYAEYAHRGAYPLMCTALLSAAFILVALKPKGSAEASPTIRALVYLWIGQNVLLVISSILRLDLYVATYSLTLWRAASFIWMLLVGVGLLLIVRRIAGGHSNAWLVKANLTAAAIALYASSLTNFSGFIASYNVAHCLEISGQGTALDREYLAGLGVEALPAIDRFLRLAKEDTAEDPVASRDEEGSGSTDLAKARDNLASSLAAPQDWRAWTYREARLRHRYARLTAARLARPAAR